MPLRCLMISLEKGLFDPNNRARKRIAHYGAFVDQLDIIVFGTQPCDEDIAPNVHVTSTRSSSRWWYVFDALALIWKQRHQKKYDVILSQDLHEMGLIAYIAARLHNAAFAPNDVGYFFHGSYYVEEAFGNRFRALLGRWLLKRADAIRVMSQRTENFIVNDRQIPREQIVRYPFDVDAQFFTDAYPPLSDEEEALLGNRSYFLIPARFVPIKRIDLALRAFADCVKTHPDVLLILLGQGPLKPDFERQIQELKLERNVFIRPWTQAMVTWYKRSLATVITSDREGYAMTALESLVCGTPVIMTDVGCAREIVIDRQNGYVVPVGDVSAIAQAMRNMVEQTHPVKQGAIAWRYIAPTNDMKTVIDLAILRKAEKNKTRTN